MKIKIALVLILLVLALTACAPVMKFPPTEKTFPSAVPSTGTATFIAPTPYPTLIPHPIFTPDTIQVARWQEYQLELAKVLLADYFLGDSVTSALCEWDILGRSELEVYVWAVCVPRFGGGSERLPAVIYLDTNGAIQKVSVPMHSTSSWDSQIHKMFPAEVIDKFYLYSDNPPFGRVQEMFDHIHYRQTHPEEPPMIVLGKAVTATPSPTKPVVAVLTPDAIQIARWKEYQAALAKAFICNPGRDCNSYENTICEWDILGRATYDVYVWAVCWNGIGPVSVHLNADGSIRSVETPTNVAPWESSLFPKDIQTKIYFYGLSERSSELTAHFNYRLRYPDMPPLIVLSSTQTATPTP